MILKLAIGGAVFWFLFIVIIWQLKQTPEAQLRERLNKMIDQAEADRLKKTGKKKSTAAALSIEEGLEQAEKRESLYVRVISPIVHLIEERIQRLAPTAIREQLEEKIFRAGKTGSWSVQHLVTFWCFSIAIITVGAIMFAQQHPEINPVQRITVIGIGIFMGAAIPFAILNSKIRQRQRNIRKQLPEFLDILCVSVQAGLSFDGAVAKMVKRMKGPLIDEFRRMQNDVALGMTHQYSLTAMARRCDVEEIYLFTTSVIQAEKLGTSMTRTLKVQADNMRERHRQWVKSEALKAPVKILFPMILFIFPSMFIVLLFPAMFTLMQNLGK